MNPFQKLFKKRESDYKPADSIIIKLTAIGMAHIYKREHEDSSQIGKSKEQHNKKFFEAINDFKKLDVNHRHLTMIVDLSTSDIKTNDALSSFLEKNNFVIDVFGEIINVSENFVTIFDIDKTKQLPRITTINIGMSPNEISKLKKGDKKSFKIKIAKNIHFLDAENLPSYIDKLLNFHLEHDNYLVRIISKSQFRFDITGKLVSFNGQNGVDLMDK